MGDAILAFFQSESTQALLSDAMRSHLSQWLIVVGVVWATMGRKVSARFKELNHDMREGLTKGLSEFQEHFKKIEVGLNQVAVEVNSLKTTVSKDLSVHAKRLEMLEGGLVQLSSRLDVLEKTTKGE